MRPFLVTTLLLVRASSAFAHAISDDFTLGATQATSTNPSSWFLSDRVGGVAELGEKLTLRLDTTYTYDAPTPPPAGANFRNDGGNIFLLNLSADWQATRRFSFYVGGSYSPPSTTSTDTSVDITVSGKDGEKTESTDAQLSSRSQSGGGSIGASFDTDGESNAETTVDASIGANYYDSTQQLTAFWSKIQNRVIPASQYQQYCDSHKATLTPRQASLCNLAAPHQYGLLQLRFNAAITETLYDNTDLGLSATYYLYNQDPTQVGYYSKTVTGRTDRPPSSTDFGGGMPVAAYWYSLAPSLTHRFGKFSTGMSLQFAQYVSAPGEGFSYDLMLGIKLQYKFNSHFRLWLKGNGQRDVDSTGTSSISGWLTLGAKYIF